MSVSLLNPFAFAPAVATITGLTLPGTAGNYASTPDSADLDIVGDLAMMCDLAMTDWTPSGSQALNGKFVAGAISYTFRVTTAGLLQLTLSADGTATGASNSTAAPTVADGAYLCVGVTYRVSDQRIQFWTAPSGTTTYPGGTGWTQLGTNVTSTKTSIFSSTTAFSIGGGSSTGAPLLNGTMKRARVWASIDGTDERFDANFTGVTILGTRNPTTLVDAAKGATVTVNGSAWNWAA